MLTFLLKEAVLSQTEPVRDVYNVHVHFGGVTLGQSHGLVCW